MNSGHDLGGCAGGREQSGKGLAVEFLVSKFGKGRHLGNPWSAMSAGDSERTNHAAFDEGQSNRNLVERELDLTADQIIGGRSIAAVMHGEPLQAQSRLHQFAEQMIGGTRAG